jgi:hypothetical protein
VERSELENLLARVRVKFELSRKQSEEQDEKSRQNRASLVSQEVDAIAMTLTDQQIIRELRNRRVDFDPLVDRSKLKVILAMSKLGMLPTNVNSTMAMSNVNVTISNALSNSLSMLEGFKQRVTFIGAVSSVGYTSANVENVADNDDDEGVVIEGMTKRNKFIESARKFSEEVALTEYEKKAQAILKNEDEVSAAATHNERGRSRNRNHKQMMTNEEIRQNISEALFKSNSFDEALHWALKKSRAHLVQLLEFRGESVPKYAPLSMVASIFADSIIIEHESKMKTATEPAAVGVGSNFEASADANRRTSTGANDDMNTQKTKYPQAESKTKQKPVGRKQNKYDIDSYDSFALEKDIISESYKNLRTFFANFQLDFPPHDQVASTISEGARTILNSVLAGSLKSALSAVAGVGIDVLLRISKWSLGRSFLLPSHTLMLVAASTVIMRKGVIFFFGSFIGLRFLRQILSQAVNLNDEIQIINEKAVGA